MDTTVTSEDEEIGFMNIDETDFNNMTWEEQRIYIELEGYVVLPKILDDKQCNTIKCNASKIELDPKPYSQYQRNMYEPQWESNEILKLVAHPPTIDFLTKLFGDEIVFMGGYYQDSLPGAPPISLHTDWYSHGSTFDGYKVSCPTFVRVLYYLDDLTEKRAPFRVIPRSHLSMHNDTDPYVRYISHPDELTCCVNAGDVMVVHNKVWHGTHPNIDSKPRKLIWLQYRPEWAAPISHMPEWADKYVDNAPDNVKPFLKSVNTRVDNWHAEHKPRDMKTGTDALNVNRFNKTLVTLDSRGG